VSFDIPPAIVSASPNTASSKILALIEGEEGKYQISLSDTYQEMGEKTFKGLRRALPLTRQKLDWDKVQKLLPGWPFSVADSWAGDGLQAGGRTIRIQAWVSQLIKEQYNLVYNNKLLIKYISGISRSILPVRIWANVATPDYFTGFE